MIRSKMKWWAKWWWSRTSGRRVLMAFGALMVCNILLAGFHAALDGVAPGRGTPDLLPFVGASELFALLESLGSAGRQAYLPIANVDMVYPLVYGSCILLTLTWGLGERLESSAWWRAVLMLPAVGVMADYVENVAARVIVNGWPQPADGLATVWVYAHGTKWLTLLPSIVLALGVLIYAMARMRHESRSAP